MARPKTGTSGQLGDCDRCIDPGPATHVQRLSFAVGAFDLRLCDPCGEKYWDAMTYWSRLGTLVEEQSRTFRTPRKEVDPASRGVVVWGHVELPDVVSTAPADDRDDEIPIIVSPRASAENLPPGHEEWSFTEHAEDRLVERGISSEEALWCAVLPDRTEPSKSEKYPDCVVHIRGPVRIVVDATTKRIVTVTHRATYEKPEQELQSA